MTDYFASAYVSTRGMSSQKRYYLQCKKAIEVWRGVLPEWYAEMVPRWERYVVARTMDDAGFSKKDIAKALECSVGNVNVMLQGIASHPGSLLSEHQRRKVDGRQTPPDQPTKDYMAWCIKNRAVIEPIRRLAGDD